MNNIETWQKILTEIEFMAASLQQEQERADAIDMEIELLRERAHKDPRAARAVAAVDAFMEDNQESLENLRISAEKLMEKMDELNRRMAQDVRSTPKESVSPQAVCEAQPVKKDRRSFA